MTLVLVLSQLVDTLVQVTLVAKVEEASAQELAQVPAVVRPVDALATRLLLTLYNDPCMTAGLFGLRTQSFRLLLKLTEMRFELG